MPKPVSVHAAGLWSFKDLTGDPTNSMCLRIRFSTKVTNEHKRDVLDAIHAWMRAQKMIADNGGRPISPQEAVAKIMAEHEQDQEDDEDGT